MKRTAHYVVAAGCLLVAVTLLPPNAVLLVGYLLVAVGYLMLAFTHS